MKDCSMTYAEILSHSLPFLEALSSGINRIRIIELGGNPDPDDEEDKNGTENNYSVPEDCGESDALFYGTLNELLR